MGAVDMSSLADRMKSLGENLDPPLVIVPAPENCHDRELPPEDTAGPCPCADCDCPDDRRIECSFCTCGEAVEEP